MKVISNYMWIKTSRIVLSLFVLILLLPSCSQKHIIMIEGQPGEDETLVTLSLALPGNVAPKTRSLTTAQEDAVDNLWVLAFEANGGNYSYRAKCVKEGANYNVKLRTGNWDLVLVANAENILADKASLLTTTNNKATVLNGLTLEHTTKWNATPGSSEYVSIPMCSDPQELVNKTIAKQSPQMTVGPVALYRMLARVNVALGSKGGVDAKDNFTITSVHFYNRNTQGYLAPDRTAAGEDKAKLHDFPTGSYGVSNVLEYKETEIVSGTSCTNEIYVSEVNNTSAIGLALTTRPCLVVGGIYNGATHYYRVDFSTGAAGSETYLDILRNHSYNINISAVNGPGYPSPEEAFNSQPVNIEVTIMPWDDGKMNDVIFDGQYGLGVNSKEFTFFKDAMSDQIVGGVNELLALTTYEGDWTVTVKNSDKLTNATASTDAKWLKVKAKGGGSEAYALTASGNTMQRFFIFAAPNTSGAERTAYIHVKVKKLMQEIKVTQTTKAGTYIKFTNGGNEITELVWDNRNHDATHSLTAKWLPTDKLCNITTFNSSTSEFKYSLPTGGLGVATNTGGTQTYDIKPQPITESDPGYPFIERVSLETFKISTEGTTISKSITLRQINYALLATGFPTINISGGQKSGTIRCNADWTVRVTTGEILIDHYTQSGAADTTEGSNNFSYKFKNGLFGKATFTFSPATDNLFTPVTVTVESTRPPFAAYPGVIGYDPVSETLNLNGVGWMVYFKYGGIIAMYAGLNKDIWKNDGSLAVFNPSNISVSTYKSFPTPIRTDNATIGKENVDKAFHIRVYNARNGNGDPCRFIKPDGMGMTVQEIKDEIAVTNKVPDQGYWRLPTNLENCGVAFTYPFAPAWVLRRSPSDAILQKGHTFKGLNKGQAFSDPDKEWDFLPAAGCRDMGTGSVVSQSIIGGYWSSTSPDLNYGNYLNFIEKNYFPEYWYNQTNGFPVRCVRQP